MLENEGSKANGEVSKREGRKDDACSMFSSHDETILSSFLLLSNRNP